jgi:hypothetical protein
MSRIIRPIPALIVLALAIPAFADTADDMAAAMAAQRAQANQNFINILDAYTRSTYPPPQPPQQHSCTMRPRRDIYGNMTWVTDCD